MDATKQEFYTKLLAKLQKIQAGELSLDDYLAEVQEKIKPTCDHSDLLPVNQKFGRCPKCNEYVQHFIIGLLMILNLIALPSLVLFFPFIV
jgi:hypothetical protein